MQIVLKVKQLENEETVEYGTTGMYAPLNVLDISALKKIRIQNVLESTNDNHSTA